MDIKAFNTMVGRNIRFLREERGLSVEDLAKLSQGLSRPLITKIENNRTEDNKHKKQIALEHIEMLASALKVPVDVILENNEKLNVRLHKLSDEFESLKINKQMLEATDRMLIEVSFRGPREQAKVLRLVGMIDYQRGKIESAIYYLQHGLDIATQSLDLEMINILRYNLASAFFVIGKYDILIQLIEKNLGENVIPEKRGRDLYLLGLTYTAQRTWEKAIEVLLLAIDSLRNTDQILLEGRCYHTLGELYKNIGQYDRSIYSAEMALKIAKDTKDEIGEIYSLKTLGEVFMEHGSRQEAMIRFAKALEKAQKIRNFRRMEMLKMEFYISLCNMDLKSMKKWLEEIEQFEISPRDIAEMYKETARMASQLGEFLDSIQFYEKAIQKLEK